MDVIFNILLPDPSTSPGDDRRFGTRWMAGKAHAIAYWLLPEAAAREVFSRKIRGLARQFGARLFEPHVTIFIAPENSRAPLEVLHAVGPVDIELAIHRIGFSEQFAKTLFVEFERNSVLQQLGDAIWKASGARDRYLIEPHLSLLYAKLPANAKQKLVDNMRLPFRDVGFTSICVMRCARPTTRAIEVEQWKLLAP